MKVSTELQSMAVSFQEILAGKRPWTPLGNFMNAWYAYHADKRLQLVCDPLQEPEDISSDNHRWASFCAASVEYLCERYTIACPEWVHCSRYVLDEPWFYSLGAHKPEIQERLKHETPEPFTRRNIFCGNRIFINKYDGVPAQRQSA
jgi:hypothetical protein